MMNQVSNLLSRIYLGPHQSEFGTLAIYKKQMDHLVKISQIGSARFPEEISAQILENTTRRAEISGHPFTLELCEHFGATVGALAAAPSKLSESQRSHLRDLALRLAPALCYSERLQMNALDWLEQIFNKLPDGKRDWVGIYWKESYIDPSRSKSSDLVVGPYIGPRTPHLRIAESAGLCGLAMREGRTINVDDVGADSRFLACSPLTRSEIVIPIRNSNGMLVGELDIDSNQIASFSNEDQTWLEEWTALFGESLRST